MTSESLTLADNFLGDWGHYIGGVAEPLASAQGEIVELHDPATGALIGRAPTGGGGDADRAVQAAVLAQPAWASRSVDERRELVVELAARIEAAADELARIDVLETGKTIGLANALMAGGPAHVRDFVAASDGFFDRQLAGGHRQLREPYGVVGIIVPWNAPVEIVMRTLPAALLAGNTVVIKPSERAPFAVRRLVELLQLPPGVVNVLMGDGSSGKPLVGHPDVDFIIHTGSVGSGRDIAAVSGAKLRPALLELGGKDPVIVDRGIDVEWAAELVALGSFINTGQLCTAIERIYVVEEIADEFIEALIARAKREVVGPGLDPATTVGPMIDDAQRAIVHAHVESAVKAGATVRLGGVLGQGPGFFYPPTVLTNVTPEMDIMANETFGPVAPVRVVASIEAAVLEANESTYGLAATVLTNRPEGIDAAAKLKVGTIWVNTYLAGTDGARSEPRGVSGLGIVGDRRAVLEAVSSPKVLHIQHAPSEK
jgi:succinate-semialdehyde dehydrogenase/glutarate-semialdehyde dehydrogenase